MGPETLVFLIPIVAILAGTYQKVVKTKADAAAQLGRATGHIEDALADARADRERLRRRVEALEAIVTSDGFDLEREARRAGLTGAGLADASDGPPGRIDAALLDESAPDMPGRRPSTRQRDR